MYINSYSFEHVYWSETRFYMTFIMGATMATVMLLFMLNMYKNKGVNAAIFLGSVVMFAGALWLVRSQETIQGESWMSAMIPHHSIAIMTSERAELTDPRIEALASEIVTAQNREISEMRFLMDDIEANGEAGPEWPLGEADGPAEIEGLQEAIATPVIAGIRPAPLKAEEITRTEVRRTMPFHSGGERRSHPRHGWVREWPREDIRIAGQLHGSRHSDVRWCPVCRWWPIQTAG
jgi:DUF305 family protein family protein